MVSENTFQRLTPRNAIAHMNMWFFAPFFLWVLIGFFLVFTNEDGALFYFFNSHYTTCMDRLMPYITKMGEWQFASVALLLPLCFKRTRNWEYFSMAALSEIAVNICIHTTKAITNLPRPMLVYKDAPWLHKLPDWQTVYHHSFPSGHTASAFSVFTLLALILPKPWQIFGLHFFILAWLVAWSRMYLAAHFFTDVLVGSLIGTLVTYAVVYGVEQYVFKHADKKTSLAR